MTVNENSEYDDAKNEQAFMEGRILELEKMIRNAKVIDEDAHQEGTVTVGSLVKVKDIEFDEINEYRLVGNTAFHKSLFIFGIIIFGVFT